MTHPDPRAAEILDRNARGYAEATTAPPPDVAENTAAYLAWLRNKPLPQRPQVPRGPRPYLDRSQIPRRTRRSRLPPVQRAPGRSRAGRQAPVLNRTEQNRTPPAAAAPSCEACGTALDPDDTCLTCRSTS